ncbi:MAG: zinc-ribbon domain-containing protein [Asgard group archaeon]|nr:zinc-ribbon domain-containing protein [Asgard group archaeon]
MAKCYIHSQKASVRNCSECAKSICQDCVFQEVVASRVTRYSRQYGNEVELDYGFFCPDCFISFAREKGFDKGTRGVYFRFTKSPSLIALIILWGSIVMGFVVNIFFPIGYVLYIATIIAMIALKATASKNYKKYLRAEQLIHPQRAKEPVKKKSKEEGNFCPKCGSNNPPESKFCNECGSAL